MSVVNILVRATSRRVARLRKQWAPERRGLEELDRQFPPGVDPRLGEDGFEVALRRPRRDRESDGDLLVRFMAEHGQRDLRLAVRQPIGAQEQFANLAASCAPDRHRHEMARPGQRGGFEPHPAAICPREHRARHRRVRVRHLMSGGGARRNGKRGQHVGRRPVPSRGKLIEQILRPRCQGLHPARIVDEHDGGCGVGRGRSSVGHQQRLAPRAPNMGHELLD